MPEPIDIIFLGTGCGIPSLSRHHPAILLHKAGDYILFDCGESCQLQLDKAGVSPMRISKIFITHWHADHFAGLLPLIETLQLSKRQAPLEIYGPEASRFVSALLKLSYFGVSFKIIAKNCSCRKTEKIFETDQYKIFSVPVKHSVPAVGYCFEEKAHWKIDLSLAKKFGLKAGPLLQKIKQDKKLKIGKLVIKLEDIAHMSKGRKIVYSGDSLVCKSLFLAAKGADILIHDATFIEPMPERPHSSVIEVSKLAKEYGIKRLILTHLSRRYKSSKEILNVAKPIFKNVVIAEDLMKVRT